jgi:hypothetical protein
MKKSIFSLLIVLMLVTLLATPVSAGPGIGLSGVTFTLGSLIAEGTITKIGNTDVKVLLQADGIPDITCTNYGSNDVPGQSSPKVSASGQQLIPGDSTAKKNGWSPFGVETVDPTTIDWKAGGCPNANWTARIDFIRWTHAKLSFYDNATNGLLLTKDYACTTTRYPAAVSCSPLP